MVDCETVSKTTTQTSELRIVPGSTFGESPPTGVTGINNSDSVVALLRWPGSSAYGGVIKQAVCSLKYTSILYDDDELFINQK